MSSTGTENNIVAFAFIWLIALFFFAVSLFSFAFIIAGFKAAPDLGLAEYALLAWVGCTALCQLYMLGWSLWWRCSKQEPREKAVSVAALAAFAVPLVSMMGCVAVPQIIASISRT